MKYGKFVTLLVLVMSILMALECWSMVVYYGRGEESFVSILFIIFICCPATIVSLDILTNGLVLRGFLGHINYGGWGE